MDQKFQSGVVGCSKGADDSSLDKGKLLRVLAALLRKGDTWTAPILSNLADSHEGDSMDTTTLALECENIATGDYGIVPSKNLNGVESVTTLPTGVTAF